MNYTNRAYIRISPTYNINDDFTWTKGLHTVTAGVNIRFVRNGYTNYANAWATYSASRSNLPDLDPTSWPIRKTISRRTG